MRLLTWLRRLIAAEISLEFQAFRLRDNCCRFPMPRVVSEGRRLFVRCATCGHPSQGVPCAPPPRVLYAEPDRARLAIR